MSLSAPTSTLIRYSRRGNELPDDFAYLKVRERMLNLESKVADDLECVASLPLMIGVVNFVVIN